MINSDPFFIEPHETGLRLDVVLKERFKPQFSRTYFASLIDEGLVLVNGKILKKREKVNEGDAVEVFFREEEGSQLEPENIPLDVIFEDKDIIVVNKPAGMVVHPAPGNWSKTFVNALLYHCREIESIGTSRPGIVHRLDKDTSGLIVAAKNIQAQRKLIEMFSERSIYKEYRAICFGAPSARRVETLIGRDPKNRQKMAVLEEGGRRAITNIEILEKKSELSLIKAVIETGRTHQIRVHMKHVGAPILGDEVYGISSLNKKYKAKRTLLHAYKLKFLHPITNAPLEFTAPIPEDFTCVF